MVPGALQLTLQLSSTEEVGVSDSLALLVYSDLSYRKDEHGISSVTPSFVAWLGALSDEVDHLTVLGRVSPRRGRAAFPLRQTGNLTFVELPYYESLHDVPAVLRALPGSVRRFSAVVRSHDAVVLFGPHPLSVLFGAIATWRHVPVFVGVRENLSLYLSHRVRGWRRRVARPAAWLLQTAHVALGRSGGAVVVGSEMGELYRARLKDRVLETGISLVPADALLPEAQLFERPWPGRRLIAVVERLDPDKNAMILLDVAERLQPNGWTIEVAGTGSLADELAQGCRSRGLSDCLLLRGRLDREELDRLYARASVFLHVSLTEGQPQVLYEAASAGLPIVATAVGGVASALAGGKRGLLVPPRDVEAIVSAVDRLEDDALRTSLIRAAWQWASGDTLELQVRRVARFIAENCSASARPDDGAERATDDP
jgi:glycosyltransferase involved in cell wall biosynthesis